MLVYDMSVAVRLLALVVVDLEFAEVVPRIIRST